MRCRILSVLLVLSIVTPAAVPAFGADQAILVLDASGSMWGQIDKKPKIEIARETMKEVLGSLAEDLSLGFIAYGHRRKGDCADIELLVPPTVGSAAAIGTAAAAITPKGKTPLSAAVAQAAETLKYSEEAATVILITDGLETCDEDPCALGNRLAETGVDFTAHVVGFGLTDDEGRQVACLAENTGGMYLQAADAEQLGDALTQTVAVAAAVEPAPEPEPEAEAPAPPPASVAAPETVTSATRFTVDWDGPGGKHDSIQIWDPQARSGDGKIVRTAYLRYGDLEKKQVELAAPARLGTVQIRYWDGAGRRVLATADVEVTEGAVALEAADSIEQARTLTVGWRGPGGRRDRIEIYDPEGNLGEGKVVRNKLLKHGDEDAREVKMPAPAKVGSYVLRYWNAENRTVLAERPLEVVEAQISLTAPEQVESGRTIRIGWEGPGARYDDIQIYDPNARQGEGKVIRHKRVRHGNVEERHLDLPAPAKAGTYELRYWNGDNKRVLATRDIEIIAANVELVAPDSVERGRTIKIQWTGPGARYDAIRIFDPNSMNGEGRRVREKRVRNDDFENRTVKMPAPAKPGAYELQYWNGENKAILATRAIEVTTSDVSLDAPDEVNAGQKFVVVWAGPGAGMDEVRFLDQEGKRHRGGRRVVHGQFDERTVQVTAPKTPGTYKLQYWNGDNKVVLTERPITVR